MTANPATTEWLGLATQDGHYAIQLGAGCDGIAEGTNVFADTSGDIWTLQVLDVSGSPVGDHVCTVVQHAWMGNLPCFKGPDGECDVEYA